MLIQNLDHLRYVARRFKKYPWFAYDTETVGRNVMDFKPSRDALVHGRADVIAFSLCYRGESYSAFTARYDPRYPTMYEWCKILADLWYDPKITKVCHNIKYDINVTMPNGLEMPVNIWDTLFGCWLADVNREKDLKSRAAKLGRLLTQTKAVPFENPKRLSQYVEEDVIATDELYQVQMISPFLKRPVEIGYTTEDGYIKLVQNDFPQLEIEVQKENISDFDKVFIRLQEMPVVKAAIRAEKKGMLYDTAAAKTKEWQLRKDILADKAKIYQQADRTFNVNSADQLVSVFNDLGIESPLKTPGGKQSVNAEALYYMKDMHPIVDTLIEFRKRTKLQSTYLSKQGLIYYVNEQTGRIHTSLNTAGARTGRFSCTNPNLQTIPSANDTYGIKSLFVAPKGRKIICLDYSQIEIRVMCIFCKDVLMSEVLNDPEGDIHSTTAREFGVNRSPQAKYCNFNLQYGGGGYMLAKILTLAGAPTDKQTGDQYKRRYDATYPNVKAFREQMYAFHRREGYFPMLTGRKVSVENLNSPQRKLVHKAETRLANNVIQGSAQDLLKASIVRNDPYCINPDREALKLIEYKDSAYADMINEYSKVLDRYRAVYKAANLNWLLQVHDEVIYEVDEKAAEEVIELIAEVMTWMPYFEPVTDFQIPIRADGGVADNWYLAKGDDAEYKVSK